MTSFNRDRRVCNLKEMSTCSSLQIQVASIMEVLSNTAVAELTKLVDDGSAALRLEMCRSQRENEALKTKLLLMEKELRTLRGCGEGTPDNSLNISFEVQVCDEFGEAQGPEVARKTTIPAVERVFDERLSTSPAKDEQYVPVEMKKDAPVALDIKYETGSRIGLNLSEDWLEEDPKTSQSQLELKISEENACGTSEAAATNSGGGPLFEEGEEQSCPAGDPEKGLRAELKQEPDGEPLTPGHPLLGSGCDKTSQWHVLQAHESIHTEKKPHVCTDCGKRFPYKGYLKIHQRVHTREKPFVCAQCGKSFSQISTLKTHQITHTGEKGFRCTVCNKSFAYLNGLKRHQSVHTGEKPHSCDECGKTFAKLSSLKTHQRVHTGEKPHSCDNSGKSFAKLCTLKSHQSVHTGEKPHICDECGKSFAHLCNLKTHQRVHTGEKPYGCTLCGKSFSQNPVLQKHILTHS